MTFCVSPLSNRDVCKNPLQTPPCITDHIQEGGQKNGACCLTVGPMGSPWKLLNTPASLSVPALHACMSERAVNSSWAAANRTTRMWMHQRIWRPWQHRGEELLITAADVHDTSWRHVMKGATPPPSHPNPHEDAS